MFYAVHLAFPRSRNTYLPQYAAPATFAAAKSRWAITYGGQTPGIASTSIGTNGVNDNQKKKPKPILSPTVLLSLKSSRLIL